MHHRPVIVIYKTFTISCFIFLSIGTLYPQSGYSKKDTVLITRYLDKSQAFNENSVNDYDSAIYYINKSLIISRELSYNIHLIPIYKEYIHHLLNIGDYPKALNFCFKIMEELEINIEKKGNTPEIQQEYIRLFTLLGFCYFYMDDLDKSLMYYQLALDKTSRFTNGEELREGNFETQTVQILLYANIGSLHLKKEDFINARINFEKALLINESISNPTPENEINKGKIYNNLGIISRGLSDHKRAFEYYKKAYELFIKNEDKNGLIQVYNNMGNSYYDLEEYDKALEILHQSIDLCQKNLNLNSEKLATNTLALIYAAKKDYKNAYMTIKKELTLNENLLLQENIRQISQIENQYQQDRLIKQEKLEQQIIMAKKEKNVLFAIGLVIIMLFICIVLLLFYRHSKTKIRQQLLQSKNLELEKQNLELEKQNLELRNTELGKDIENKDKELTTYVMYLSQKNNFMDNVMNEISQLIDSPAQISKNKLASIMREMKTNIDTTSWEEFEIRFQQVHQDFYIKLQEAVPNLTLNEKRLCAFLRLNMTTKEISSLTFQSIKSIQVARTRLRKKMQMEKDETLISFLQKL